MPRIFPHPPPPVDLMREDPGNWLPPDFPTAAEKLELEKTAVDDFGITTALMIAWHWRPLLSDDRGSYEHRGLGHKYNFCQIT
eukprot:g12418.t1